MPKRVLVVDDEPDIRTTLGILLRARGHQVEEAEDGRAALARLQAQPFDLVMLDLLMPDLTGYDVLTRLAPETLARTPIVVLTAKGADRDIMQGYSCGATYYITKPFKNQQVVDITDYLIGDLNAEQKKTLEKRL